MPNRVSDTGKWLLRPKHIPHGHNSSYTNWGCRCELCTQARLDHLSIWRSTPAGKRSARKNHLKRVFGMTLDQFNNMLEQQDHKCKICLGTLPENKPGRFTCIDHDHITGQIRGLLCIECNSGIGFLKENADVVLRAARYIQNAGNI